MTMAFPTVRSSVQGTTLYRTLPFTMTERGALMSAGGVVTTRGGVFLSDTHPDSIVASPNDVHRPVFIANILISSDYTKSFYIQMLRKPNVCGHIRQPLSNDVCAPISVCAGINACADRLQCVRRAPPECQ